jgi:hypothetical protein
MLRRILMLLLLGYFVSKVLDEHDGGRSRVTGRRAMPQRDRKRRTRKPARKWDMVDERSDESFPASDPPGTY